MTRAHQVTHSTPVAGTSGAHKLCARLGYAIGCAVAVATASAPASALSAKPEAYFGDVTPLSNAELRELRGGIMIGGVDFDFGATVRVFVDGPLVAESTLTLNSDGSISRNLTIHDPTLVSEFTDPSQLAGSGIDITGPDGSVGVVIDGDNGVSLALNNISAGDVFGLLANNAIGRDITQTIDVNLTINNFSQIHAQLLTDMSAVRAVTAGAPNTMLMH
jgi:hypothetical protein